MKSGKLLIHSLRTDRWRIFPRASAKLFWRLSAIGRSSWISIQFIFAQMQNLPLCEDASNESDCGSLKKFRSPINRAAAAITFSVNDTLVEVGGSRSIRQRGRIGSAVLVKAIYRPFLSLCLTYAYRCASSATARRKCKRKSVHARYADRTGRVTRAYTVTSRPETRFARLIKQVIIVSAHPIFVRPCRDGYKIARRRKKDHLHFCIYAILLIDTCLFLC